MIKLKNFTLKGIIILGFFITFFVLTTSYILSMYFIFSSQMENQMRVLWVEKADSVSKQARFSIITESTKDLKNILETFNSQKVQYVSVHKIKNEKIKELYSSGNNNFCKNIDQTTNSFVSKKTHICINRVISNNMKTVTIGNILLIVSKRKLNRMIKKSVLNNIFIILFLTSIIFSLVYFATKKILSPLVEFSKAMKKVSKKENGIRLKNEGTKDVQHVQNTFNSMVSVIEKHQSNLNKKVKERTLELLKAYKDAKGASQVKSDILKIVSHEMRTPLTGAVLYLDLMEAGKGSYIPEITKYHERLEILIDNILDYTKATDNNIIVKNTLFSISSLISEISAEFTPLLKGKNNCFKLNSSFKKNIYSDKNLIKQILANFLSNANKFTKKGTVILNCYEQNSYLFISILDSGCGITEENLQKIFDPFWQVDMSSSRNYEGTGLGLSICSLFAETLGGTIDVKSKVDTGSIFTLLLPLSLLREHKNNYC